MRNIEPNIKLSEIENEYGVIYQENDKPIHIQLPDELEDEGGFGINVSIMQFISTLSRNKPDCILVIASDKKEYLRKFIKKPYSLVSAYMINNHKLGKDTQLTTNKNDTLIHGVDCIEAMQNYNFEETMDGDGVLLSCFSGAKNEFILPLYKRPDYKSLRGTLEFEKVTEKVIGTYQPNFIETLPKAQLFSISTMFRELFENTNDHSAGTESKLKYNWEYPNFRAIFTKAITFDNISEENFKKYSGDDQPLRTFFLNTLIDSTSEGMEFIEVSIIDSGIGIAKNWHLKKYPDEEFSDVDLETEEKYITKAFKLRKTTKSASHTAGIGLDSVIRHLRDLKAFVRLRTGRLCLYQDFSKNTSEKEFIPQHWNDEKKELFRAEGTTYTILIPCKGITVS